MKENPQISKGEKLKANREPRTTNNESLTKKLALGTVQFGLDYGISNELGQTPIEEVSEILREAYKTGITTIDTARAYGSSEQVLGITGVKDFDIVSKLNPNEYNTLSLEAQVEDSLKKLKVEQLYGVLFHNAQSALENPTAVKKLGELKDQGVVRKAGYSLYTPNELDELVALYGLPDIIQVPYNILDRRFESRLKELHAQGVEIHTRSTFLQGLFFVNPERLDSFFHSIKPFLTVLQREFIDTKALAGFLLNEVTNQDYIDKVVIGVNTVVQLKANISGMMNYSSEIKVDIPQVNENVLMPNLWPI